MLSLPEITVQTLRQHGLFVPGSRVIVAVSGGADSLALLHVLHNLRLDVRLYVATLDHMLRGPASAADTRFVLEVAHRLGIPAFSGHCDVQRLTGQAGGIETAARHARYDFLASIARQTGAAYIATAHHANDQAETVLLHMIRGSGGRGLAGMRVSSPLPGHPDLKLIRPFLDVPRPVIDAYCAAHGLTPRDDDTNRDTHHPRNAIRWDVLPQLERLNPGIVSGLGQMADIMAVEQDYIDAQLQQQIKGHIMIEPQRITIDRATFTGLHPALQRRFVQWACQQIQPDTRPDYDHTQHAVDVALTGGVGARAQFPGGLHLRVDYGVLAIETIDAPLPDLPLLISDEKITVPVPSITPLSGSWQLETGYEQGQARLVIAPNQQISLRTRRPGDRFAPLGLDGHTQSVKKWMINARIPRALRDSVPLLVVDEQIAAILAWPQWFISEKFAVRRPDQLVVYFSLTHTANGSRHVDKLP